MQVGAAGEATAAVAASVEANAVANPTITTRMDSIGEGKHKRIDRRSFLKGGLAAGGVLAAGGLGISRLADASQDSPPETSAQLISPLPGATSAKSPNILVILVDQMRYPVWFSPGGDGAGLTPSLRRLREGAVSFAGHYTAANDCTPARSTLLSGLYTHQTGCMITGGSTLDPRFPTWGTMLREHGYQTRWYGKWHLTRGDGSWRRAEGERALERYGFAGGTFPSPNGAPGQGWRLDGRIAGQFASWFRADPGEQPWCTTVSFVNPHDIAWWYLWSDRVLAESSARSVISTLPPNFETPGLLIERGKPRLQRSLQETAAASFGPVPFEGPEVASLWSEFLNLYAKLQRIVDAHIGTVLDTLQSRPEVAENTVVLFTSDHGEYGGSHGLRGKGAGAYEEAIRVPLIVKDNRAMLTQDPEATRTQLTSSVDLAPLLLSIATGSNDWREDARYEHLAERADLAAILADPNAPGRPFVMHATDETVTEFAIEPYDAEAPRHVIALRTPEAKLATYSNWASESIELAVDGQERELYDYSDDSGRLELHNGAGESALEQPLSSTLDDAIARELRRPLPAYLAGARAGGFDDYFATALRASAKATAERERREEKTFEQFPEPSVPTGGAGNGETRVRRPFKRASRPKSR